MLIFLPFYKQREKGAATLRAGKKKKTSRNFPCEITRRPEWDYGATTGCHCLYWAAFKLQFTNKSVRGNARTGRALKVSLMVENVSTCWSQVRTAAKTGPCKMTNLDSSGSNDQVFISFDQNWNRVVPHSHSNVKFCFLSYSKHSWFLCTDI